MGQRGRKKGDLGTTASQQHQVLSLSPSERASPRSTRSLVQEPAGTNRSPQEPVTWLTWQLLHSVQRLEQYSVPASKTRPLPFYSTKPGAGGWGWAGTPGKEQSGGWGCPGDPVTLRCKNMGSPHLGPCRARLAQREKGVRHKREWTLVKLPVHVNKEERPLPSRRQSCGGV